MPGSIGRSVRVVIWPESSLERIQEFLDVEAKGVILPLELERGAELALLGGAGDRHQRLVRIVGDLGRGRIGERIVAEQVAQARDDRIDLGERAAVPQIDDVAVAELEQLAVEPTQQPVELAGRDPQLIVAPVVRLQPRQVEVDRPPVVVVALQALYVSEQFSSGLAAL